MNALNDINVSSASKTARLLPIGCLILLLQTSSTPADVISPGSYASTGVELQQLDMLFADEAGDLTLDEENSTWGQINVKPETLFLNTLHSAGFVNMYAPGVGGWVVQNLYVDSSIDTGAVSTKFDLGLSSPTPLSLFDARIEYTPAPRDSFGPGGTTADHEVTDGAYNAQGAGGAGTTVTTVGLPITANALSFNPLFIPPIRVSKTQPNLKNIQTAKNQCFPMAIANSLQYLADSFPADFTLPPNHNHAKGLLGDNTLVGRLDSKVAALGNNNRRGATARDVGLGVWDADMVTAKFDFLNMNSLGNKLHHKFQGRMTSVGGLVPANGTDNFSPPGRMITAYNKGPRPTWQWICDEITNQEDVEILWEYPGGSRHAVRAYQCGTTLGLPWISVVHDTIQNSKTIRNGMDKNPDPNDTKGTTDSLGSTLVERFYTLDTDNDGFINGLGTNWNIVFAFSESVPEPASALMLILAALGLCGRRARGRTSRG